MKHLPAIFLCLIALGCSRAPHREAGAPSPEIIVTEGSPTDSAVYVLGRQAAAEMLAECATVEDVELHLLDVKARIHIINTRVGGTAATDYAMGFVEYIKENNDTLARMIF